MCFLTGHPGESLRHPGEGRHPEKARISDHRRHPGESVVIPAKAGIQK
jgi:hypothetical protein